MKKIILIILAAFPCWINAQSAGNAARIVTIQPKENARRDFELGYKRHLAWHADNKDSWAWFGWQVIGGDDFGMFIDGTFGHAWEDFDRPVAPAADAADNAVNVTPYATFLNISHCIRMESVSNDASLESRKPSALIEWHRYEIKPGNEIDFENILAAYHAALLKEKTPRRHAVYKLVNGGSQPSYIVMFPLEKISEIGLSENGMAEKFSKYKDEKSLQKVSSVILRNVSSILRYRADMSYIPE
ncbi:hypothetical protein HUU42_06245 [bacterium]|nr:hypothetical protein [bacterium]